MSSSRHKISNELTQREYFLVIMKKIKWESEYTKRVTWRVIWLAKLSLKVTRNSDLSFVNWFIAMFGCMIMHHNRIRPVNVLPAYLAICSCTIYKSACDVNANYICLCSFNDFNTCAVPHYAMFPTRSSVLN